MKKAIGIGIVLMMLAVAGPVVFAQQSSGTAPAKVPEKVSEAGQAAQPDRAVVPLSNPAKPAMIEVGLVRGSITVKGYEGKEIIVEARIREKAIGPDANLIVVDGKIPKRAGDWAVGGTDPVSLYYSKRLQNKQERSHDGMKLVTAALTGLQVEEEDNNVKISTDSWKYAIDMTIQAPVSSSLEIGSMNDGKILVENISGDIEIKNSSGAITLRNVSGNVVANTMNGDIEAVMARVAADKPLAFSTMAGDIDVTFPADLKATVKMKTRQGNIYSDFDVVLKQAPEKVEEAATFDRGRYRISFDKGLSGLINGGGPVITFTSFTGDIFIRRKK